LGHFYFTKGDYLNPKYKTELLIFIGIFLFLAIGMHFKQWINYPIEHLLALPHAGAYGLGALHPLIFTFIVYILFVSIRGIKRFFTTKK
jgi:hypothetical protein